MAGTYRWSVWMDLTEIPSENRRKKAAQKYGDVESWELVLSPDEVYDIFRTPGSQTARFMAESYGFEAPAELLVFVKRLRKELSAAFIRIEFSRRVRAEHYQLTLGHFVRQGASGSVSKDRYTLYEQGCRTKLEDYDFFDISVTGEDAAAVSRLMSDIMAGRAIPTE